MTLIAIEAHTSGARSSVHHRGRSTPGRSA
jgi:hypothetical protein